MPECEKDSQACGRTAHRHDRGNAGVGGAVTAYVLVDGFIFCFLLSAMRSIQWVYRSCRQTTD